MRSGSPYRWWSARKLLHSVVQKWCDGTLLSRRRTRRLATFESLETRVLPAITFSVVFDDPGGANSAYYTGLEQNCLAAAACWGQYLTGNCSIEIKIDFANIPTAAAGSATSFFLRNEDGFDIYAQGAAGEILTGIDNNGSTPDINITFGNSFIPTYLWVDPTPFDDVEAVPFDKTDMFSIFIHELGHGFGFNGSASPTDGSVASNFKTTWDRWLSFDGANIFFVGPNATQAYGGPVPVTFGNANHIGNPLPRPGSNLDHDVMSGFTAYNGERRRPTAVDLAILADAQVPLVGNAAPVALLLTNKVTSLAESAITTSRIKLADIDIVDDEGGANLVAVSGTDAADFEIFNGDLYLKAGTVLNFESKTNYSFNVTVDDSTVGLTPDISKSFSLTITDVNEAPTAITFANTVTTLLDSTSTASRVKLADVSVTDDALGTNVLSLTGPDMASFELLSGVLYLKAGTVLSIQKTTYQVTVNVNDSTVGSNPDASKNFTLTINTLNVVPSAINLTNAVTTLPENTITTSRVKVADIVVTDDGLGTNVLSLSGPDVLAFEISGNVLYIKAGTVLNYEAKTSYQVTVSVDDASMGATPDASTPFSLSLTDVNDGPSAVMLTNTVTSLPENTATSSQIKLADVAILDQDTQGTNVLSISGADASAFELVGNVLYLKAGTILNFESKSSYQISVDADDSSVGSDPDASKLFTLTLTNVNEAPTGINLASVVATLAENTITTTHIKLADVTAIDDTLGGNVFTLSGADPSVFELIGGVLYLKAGVALNYELRTSYQVTINVDDSSLGTNPDASTNFTLTVSDVNEPPTSLTLSAASIVENQPSGTVIGTFSSTDPDAGNTVFSFTLVSGGADNNSFTIVNGELRTTASFNYESQSSYSIFVRSSDQGGQKIDKQFTITVTDVNEAPNDITLDPASISENLAGGSVVGLLSAVDADAGGSSFTLAFAPGGTDNGSFSIVNNQLFTAQNFDFETKNSYSIKIAATDQGNLKFEKTIIVAISDVNEAPIGVNLTAASIAENQSSGTVVGTFSSTDLDASNTFTYSLTGGSGSSDNGSFTIQNGQLLTASSFDFETKNSYSIRVRTTDQGGQTFDKQFTISVTNVNDAPTIVTLNLMSIAENQPGGTAVGTFSTTDQDTGSGFTYLLIAGTGSADNGSFTISNGQLLTAASFNFEAKNSYSIRVRSTDQGGLTCEQQFTITVTNVNEAPTAISLPVTTIAENRPTGTVVGTFGSTDPDTGNTFTYTLVTGTGGTDNNNFTISNGQLLTAAGLNFESQSSHAIRVRTTDQGGQSFDATFTVTVTDVNEAPSIAANQSFNLAENSAANAVVDTVVATDPDQTTPFKSRTFSITGGNTGDTFSINAGTGQITVNNPSLLDFESNPQFSLVISVTDGGGASAIPMTVTIQLVDVNEAPTLTAIGPKLVGEDGVTGTILFNIADPETPATSLAVQAVSSNPGLIPNGNLVLSGTGVTRGLIVQPLANQSGAATITVSVSDGTNSSTQSFVVTVQAINDAPTVTGFDPQVILEDSATGPLAFTVNDIDNAINGLTITATSSNTTLVPNSGIAINGTGTNRNLVVTPVANQSGATVITLTVSDGALTTTQQFDLTVNPVDDLPVLSINAQPLAYHTSSKKIVQVDGGATLTDADTPTLDFTGAVLKVSGQAAKDQLSLINQGGIFRKGKNVLFNGTVIGTLSGGKKGVALTVNLNASATQAGIQATLRAIGFKSLDKIAGTRNLQIQVTNIGGKNPTPATKQIQVSL